MLLCTGEATKRRVAVGLRGEEGSTRESLTSTRHLSRFVDYIYKYTVEPLDNKTRYNVNLNIT